MASKSKGLGAAAKKLLTEAGYLNAMADLFNRLSTEDLTKNETTALIGARRCLQSFADARIERQERAEHAQLTAELEATREAMKNQGSGATRQTGKTISLPRRAGEGSTTN